MNKVIHPTYWLLVPSAIIAPIITILLGYLGDEIGNGFLIMVSVVGASFVFTYLNGLVFQKVQPLGKELYKIAGLSIGNAFLGLIPAIFGAAVLLMIEIEAIGVAAFGAIFFSTYRWFYNKHFKIPNDTLAIIVNLISGISCGLIVYLFVEERVFPSRFYEGYPISIHVFYTILLLLFNLSIITALFQKHRNMFSAMYIVALVAIMIDLYFKI